MTDGEIVVTWEEVPRTAWHCAACMAVNDLIMIDSCNHILCSSCLGLSFFSDMNLPLKVDDTGKTILYTNEEVLEEVCDLNCKKCDTAITQVSLLDMHIRLVFKCLLPAVEVDCHEMSEVPSEACSNCAKVYLDGQKLYKHQGKRVKFPDLQQYRKHATPPPPAYAPPQLQQLVSVPINPVSTIPSSTTVPPIVAAPVLAPPVPPPVMGGGSMPIGVGVNNMAINNNVVLGNNVCLNGNMGVNNMGVNNNSPPGNTVPQPKWHMPPPGVGAMIVPPPVMNTNMQQVEELNNPMQMGLIEDMSDSD